MLTTISKHAVIPVGIRYIMPPLMEFVATLGDDVYGITLGDLVWNTPSLLGYYKKRIGSTGVPVFAVIGNHDHNEHVKDDKKSGRATASGPYVIVW